MIPKKLEQILESLPLGTTLRRIAIILLWVLAVLIVFAGLYFIIDMVMTLPAAQHPAAVLGSIVAALTTCAGTCLLVMILLHRIRSLNTPAQGYPIVYLTAGLLRLTGELLAVFHLAAGLSTGIVYWFGTYPRLPYYDSFMWRILTFAAFPSFISGLFAILASVFQAALTLLACYLAAELLMLLRDIPLKYRR